MSRTSPARARSGFAARIRAETAAAHRVAESSGFVDDLLAGRLPAAGYGALLAQTYLIYETLEEAGRAMAGDRVAGPFVAPALLRLPAHEADLAFLLGASWRARLQPLGATRRYCERLREVAFSSSPAFIAHHYIRYLGDLSGGQIIRRSLERAYGFNGAGVRFYIFDGIAKPKLFKDDYRSKLDDAPLTEDERDFVVAEAIRAFALNRDLFDELADRWGAATQVPAQ
jgi:heme oxygenase